MEEPRLTRLMLINSRVIARGMGIRDVQRLVRTYGGKASGWVKKSSAPLIIDGQDAEYHWYECHGVGRKEIKVKWL